MVKGVNYHQKPRLIGNPVGSASVLEFAVIAVRKSDRSAVAKNAQRFVERYTVFLQIARSLGIVPFKLEHRKYLVFDGGRLSATRGINPKRRG